jgi:hypothetical protein
MTAAAIEAAPAPGAPTFSVVEPRAGGAAALQAAAQEAERTFAHRAVIGVLVGMPVGALIWTGIVGLALALGAGGWDVWPALAMGAAVGVFAGSFLGGWAGVMWGAAQLDEAEHHIVTRHTQPAP